MAITNAKIRKELDAQERDGVNAAEVPTLRKALACCSMSSDWQALARVTWESTGPLSYQTIRRWHASPMLRALLVAFDGRD